MWIFISCFEQNTSPVSVPAPIDKLKSEDSFVHGKKMSGLDNISKILMLITQGRSLSQTKLDLKMKRESFIENSCKGARGSHKGGAAYSE